MSCMLQNVTQYKKKHFNVDVGDDDDDDGDDDDDDY